MHDPSKKGGKIQFILILISGAEFLNKLGSSENFKEIVLVWLSKIMNIKARTRG